MVPKLSDGAFSDDTTREQTNPRRKVMALNQPPHVDTAVFNNRGNAQMRTLALAAAGMLIASTAAMAQQPSSQELMTSIPANSRTVTDWYKQNVYDPQHQKIGEIMDLLVNQSGQVEAAMVGVGGFLGAGEKDVAVSFNAIKPTKKNDKTYLTLNTTKDALKNAPGFRYDRQTTTWVPDNRASNDKRSSRDRASHERRSSR
jgi:PRC-barrel domain